MNSVKTVNEYLASVARDDFRECLEELRVALRETLPDASEVISYGMPAFRRKKVIVYYAAFKNHCSLFVGTTTEEFLDRLSGFKTSKGTVQFTPENRIPMDLVREMVLRRKAVLE